MEYDLQIEKLLDLFSKIKYVVLATANKDGIVTASQMCVISDGTTLYFQTNPTFEKARNIMENPNVAVTIGNVYCKGQASIIGHPTDNNYFVTQMRKKHNKTYENYTNLPNQILIKVELTECRIWGIWNSEDELNISKEESIKVLNLQKKQITKIKCDNLSGGY